LQRGVILLTGNGHARATSVCRAFWTVRADRVTSIGLLEDDAGADEAPAGASTQCFARRCSSGDDPCETLHMKATVD